MPADDRLPLPVLQGERCVLRRLAEVDVAASVVDAGYAWALVDRAGGAPAAPVGRAALAPETGALRCNAAIVVDVAPPHRRRGLAGDAIRQVVDWAFAALPELTRIHAQVDADDDAAQALLRRAGFVREGVLPRSAIRDGRVIDRGLWATYRPEHAARPADIDAALAATAATAMERA